MRKYLTRKTAVKLVTAGGVVLGISTVIALVSMFQIYAKAGCIDDARQLCNIDSQILMANVAKAGGIIGVVIICVALAIFIYNDKH